MVVPAAPPHNARMPANGTSVAPLQTLAPERNRKEPAVVATAPEHPSAPAATRQDDVMRRARELRDDQDHDLHNREREKPPS